MISWITDCEREIVIGQMALTGNYLEQWNSVLPSMDRQESESNNSLDLALAGGLAAFSLQLLFYLLAPLLSGLSSPRKERHPVPLLPPLSLSNIPAVTVAVTREERPRLQNHPRCGITTGGQVCTLRIAQKKNKMLSYRHFQEECWWNCETIADQAVDGLAIADLECLKGCFSKTTINRDSDKACLVSLIEDVTTKGTCENGYNPAPRIAKTGINMWGWNELENKCDLEQQWSSGYYYDYDYRSDSRSHYDYYDNSDSGSGSGDYYDYYDYFLSPFYDIINGTCSGKTETLLRTKSCLRSLAEQPNIIRNTLELLVQFSCKSSLYEALPFSSSERKRRPGNKRQKETTRLAPVSQVDITEGTKTELEYENTRHRYPWICSLRT